MVEIWTKTQLYVPPEDPDDIVRLGDITSPSNKLVTSDGYTLVTTDGYTLVTKSA